MRFLAKGEQRNTPGAGPRGRRPRFKEKAGSCYPDGGPAQQRRPPTEEAESRTERKEADSGPQESSKSVKIGR